MLLFISMFAILLSILLLFSFTILEKVQECEKEDFNTPEETDIFKDV